MCVLAVAGWDSDSATKVTFLPGPPNQVQPCSAVCKSQPHPAQPIFPPGPTASPQALRRLAGSVWEEGRRRAREKGRSRAVGLFPPGAPGPGSLQLPRAREAQAHSQPVVCALGLIFPQKQSSSGGWLLAWLQGAVLSSRLLLKPSPLPIVWGSSGSLGDHRPQAPLQRLWRCGNRGLQRTWFV